MSPFNNGESDRYITLNSGWSWIAPLANDLFGSYVGDYDGTEDEDPLTLEAYEELVLTFNDMLL